MSLFDHDFDAFSLSAQVMGGWSATLGIDMAYTTCALFLEPT